MVNIVNMRGPTVAEDDPQIEAAKQQVALALAQAQRGGSVAGVPIAEGRGAYQAKYGWGNALADLANKFSEAYAVRAANQHYTKLKGEQDAALQADTAKKLDVLAPSIPAGATQSPGVTLDALPESQPDAMGMLTHALAQQQPSPAGQGVDQPVPGIGHSTSLADAESPRHQALAAALAGLPARQANDAVGGAMLSTLLRAPEKPVAVGPGTDLVQEDPNHPGQFIKVATNPKDATPVRAERKTRLLDGHMAQDYNFYGDGRPDENVGAPYKHSEPPASVINMQDPQFAADTDVRARRIAAGLDPWPSANGRVSGQMAAYNAHLEALAQKYHPGVDATTYEKRKKTIENFAQGPDGRKITAFNTVTEHLPAWKATFDALQGGDVPLANQLAQSWGLNISGKDPAAALQLASQFVGGELANALISGEGTGGERDKLAADFSAKLAHGQANDVMSEAQTLMSGRLRSMRTRYESQTRTWDVDKKGYVADKEGFDAMLTPQSLDVEKNYSDPTKAVGRGPGGGATGAVVPGSHVTQSDIAAELKRRGVGGG